MIGALNNYFKPIVIISLSLNVLVAGYFIGKRIYYSNEMFFYKHFGIKQHIPNTSLQRWSKFLHSKPDTAEIIFAGTSLTESFPFQSSFLNPHIKNLGFGWNKSSDMRWQVNKYIYRRPKKIFLECGINDIRHGISINKAFSNFVKICFIVRANSPHTQLYVQSVLPTNNADYNRQIKSYNLMVINYCAQNHITYINLFSEFERYGQIDSSLTTDGIHLNPTGYFLWSRLIEQYIA